MSTDLKFWIACEKSGDRGSLTHSCYNNNKNPFMGPASSQSPFEFLCKLGRGGRVCFPGFNYIPDPWTTQGLGVLPPTQSKVCNFWLPKSLTTDSLLLTRSLTDNISSQLTHILSVTYIIYWTLTMKLERRKCY